MDDPVLIANTIPLDDLLAEFEADPEFAELLVLARMELSAWLRDAEDRE